MVWVAVISGGRKYLLKKLNRHSTKISETFGTIVSTKKYGCCSLLFLYMVYIKTQWKMDTPKHILKYIETSNTKYNVCGSTWFLLTKVKN